MPRARNLRNVTQQQSISQPSRSQSFWSSMFEPPVSQPSMSQPSMSQPSTFFPALAMQQSVWDSITNGNFIDAKIFAFSRRSREPGRVDTPKALFVNTHVLASACSYFHSTFSFSDCIQTDLKGGLPADVEPFFDLDGCGLDSDFDDTIEGDPVVPQAQDSSDASKPPQKSIKTYVIKHMAYTTLRAIIWYIYSGDITFSGGSPGVPSASAKSIYRFADEHRMDDLKKLASEAIMSSIDKLSPSELVEEACSVFTSRYPKWCRVFVERLSPILSRDEAARLAFQGKSSAYFYGELPHCKEVITSTLLCLLDASTINEIGDEQVDACNTISRVRCAWPGRTRDALRMSLEKGTFDDLELVTPSNPAAPRCKVYLATVIMGGIMGRIFSQLNQPARLLSARELTLSRSTWQAFAYYTYTGYATFEPLGSKNIEPPSSVSPSDTQFRGCPCSTKEMYNLASKLGYNQLVNLVTGNMLPSITPENVVEETFSGSSLPPRVIERGLEIICSPKHRKDRRIHSQLQEILEEAASGSRMGDFDTFSACFDQLRLPAL